MIPFSMTPGQRRSEMQPRRHEDTKKKNNSLFDAFVSSWPKRSRSTPLVPQPQSAAIVPPRLHLLAPVAMFEVPEDSVAESALERMTRRPSELAANLGGVDRVAPIVARTIRHERLQAPAAFLLRLHLVEEVADAIDDLDVVPFVAAADIILFARPP